MPADITVIDPNKVWTVNANKFESKARNCPFHGWKLTGKAVLTLVGGRLVMRDGRICE
ncbi:MAG: dihydroorotase, partial [Planctomycetes bacterium]|nr:dihydroorotase [Planctomycetota bacterium]